MALPSLISRLEHEAQRRVHDIHQNADAEVRAIEAATESAIADLMTRHLERERAARSAEYQQELAAARRQARTRELEARHAQLARVLDRARALLVEAAAPPAYRAALPSHLEEALSFLEGLETRVRCQAAIAPIVQPAIARHAGAELVTDESVGPGVVVESRDGSVVVDNTLAARLARAEPDLKVELAGMLGEPAPLAAAANRYGGR